MSNPEGIADVLARQDATEAQGDWFERVYENARATHSLMTPEELERMGARVTARPCRLSVTDGGGTSVTVECPRAVAGQWAAWLRALAQGSGWDGEVSAA